MHPGAMVGPGGGGRRQCDDMRERHAARTVHLQLRLYSTGSTACTRKDGGLPLLAINPCTKPCGCAASKRKLKPRPPERPTANKGGGSALAFPGTRRQLAGGFAVGGTCVQERTPPAHAHVYARTHTYTHAHTTKGALRNQQHCFAGTYLNGAIRAAAGGTGLMVGTRPHTARTQAHPGRSMPAAARPKQQLTRPAQCAAAATTPQIHIGRPGIHVGPQVQQAADSRLTAAPWSIA